MKQKSAQGVNLECISSPDIFCLSIISSIVSECTHLVVEKYKVHLYEDERHPSGRREGKHNVVALGVLLEFEVLAKLQARVDHRADAERHRAHSQVKASIVLDRPDGGHVRARGVRGIAVATGAARRSRRVQVAHVLSFLFSCKFMVIGRLRLMRF